ncbi:MAG: hypothetical protein ACE5H3_12945, partial [Planctomycetota bacterium]
MGEMFTLQGTGPEGRKKGRWGTILLVGIVAVLALFVAVRIFQNPVSRPLVGEFGQAFHSAEARKQALETILPGAKLPQPFVIRGAARAGDAEAVWMRRDFDDAHAILISGPEALTPDQVRTLLEELGHERLPSRQIIDEKGVQIDKRPPFVEEYRMPPGP